MVEQNIRMRWAEAIMEAKASKKASNTPALRSRCGRQACLPTDAAADELVEAIGAVAQGRCYLASGVARALLAEIRRFRRARPARETWPDIAAEPLTDRESDVLALVIDGKTNKHIARSLELAEGAVKNHVSRILEKLNVCNRTEFAARTLGRRC